MKYEEESNEESDDSNKNENMWTKSQGDNTSDEELQEDSDGEDLLKFN